MPAVRSKTWPSTTSTHCHFRRGDTVGEFSGRHSDNSLQLGPSRVTSESCFVWFVQDYTAPHPMSTNVKAGWVLSLQWCDIVSPLARVTGTIGHLDGMDLSFLGSSVGPGAAVFRPIVEWSHGVWGQVQVEPTVWFICRCRQLQFVRCGVQSWHSSFWHLDQIQHMSNRQNSRILGYVLAGHWFSENTKNWG